MRFIRVGDALLNQAPLDWQGDLRIIVQAIERARAAQVDPLCLLELCITQEVLALGIFDGIDEVPQVVHRAARVHWL